MGQGGILLPCIFCTKKIICAVGLYDFWNYIDISTLIC